MNAGDTMTNFDFLKNDAQFASFADVTTASGTI